MKIKVEQEHIDDGVPVGSRCPIALALISQGCGKVFVEREIAILYDQGSRQVALSESAQEFIRAFDDDHCVEPFEFDLPVERKHPHTEIVCPVDNSADSLNVVRNDSHSLIKDFLNKLEREPKPVVKVS